MDPFVQFQTNLQREQATADVLALLRLRDDPAALEAAMNNLQNRMQGIPAPIQNIQNFTFEVPEHSLAEVLARPIYRRARPNRHYKKENGKDYYNANEAALVYEDPDRIAGNAKLEAANRPVAAGANPPNDAELNRIYLAARQAQLNANRDAEEEEPQWHLCQRSSPNDTHQEDTVLRFTNSEHNDIDWHTTINNIHNLGRELGYTLEHYNKVMHRFVSYYKPDLSPLIAGMDANRTARFLMGLNTPKPVRQQHFEAIKTMERPVGMELRAIMHILTQRANGYYAEEPEENRNTQIENMQLLGLQQFTAGQTNTAIKLLIMQQQMENRRPNIVRLLETAIQAEELHGKPTITLKFMQNNAAQGFVNNTIPLFNSLVTPVSPLVNPHPIVMTPLVNGSTAPIQYTTTDEFGQNQYQQYTSTPVSFGIPPVHLLQQQPQGPRPPPLPAHNRRQQQQDRPIRQLVPLPQGEAAQVPAQVIPQRVVEDNKDVPQHNQDQGAAALPYYEENELPKVEEEDEEIAFARRETRAQDGTPLLENFQTPPASSISLTYAKAKVTSKLKISKCT